MKTPLMLALLAAAAPAFSATATTAADAGRQWLAGDHHVHSEWSVDWDRSTTPPTPVRGGDSPYSRSRNAAQARAFGLRWMVHTDHGGPGHSAVTRDQAYPALLQARTDVPEVIQFNGMEFDVPAGEPRLPDHRAGPPGTRAAGHRRTGFQPQRAASRQP